MASKSAKKSSGVRVMAMRGKPLQRPPLLFSAALLLFLVGNSEGFFFGLIDDPEPLVLCDKCRCPSDMLQIEDGLDCRDAGLTELPEDLTLPPGVIRADFSRNGLTTMNPATFSVPSTSLTHLDLSDNKLGGLPAGGFGGLANLTELLLSNNALEVVDEEAFRGLSKLTLLDLSYNQLSQLPGGLLAPLTLLSDLNLGFNPLADLNSSVLSTTADLKRLDLSKIGLESLCPCHFQNLTKLEWLSLAYNNLTVVPSNTVAHLARTLTHLQLSGNPIKSLGAFSFYELVNLRVLELEQMLKLETIEAYAFGDLVHLDTVILRYLPRIKSIHPKAFHTLKDNTEIPLVLQDFTLSFSVLTTLPEDLLPWSSLKDLSLEYNHWTCDCEMRWVKNSSLMEQVHDRMVCSRPMSLRGHRLRRVPEEKLTCETPANLSTSATVSILVILMIGGLSASLATVTLLVYFKRGWVCNRPPGAYTAIHRGTSTITIQEDLDNDSVA